MDVKDLRFLVAVYETGTFSRASECLGTVQSNVSARIRALEDALGGALFERHYRGVVPTAKGQELYARAKDLIATFEITERAVKVAVIRREQSQTRQELTTELSDLSHTLAATGCPALAEGRPLPRDEMRGEAAMVVTPSQAGVRKRPALRDTEP